MTYSVSDIFSVCYCPPCVCVAAHVANKDLYFILAKFFSYR